MNYQVYFPHPALAPYVKCYWTLELSAREEPPARQRVFADGCMEMIFHYGDLFKKYTTPDRPIIQSRSFVHGQVTRFIELEPTGDTGIFSVRFNPHGLQPFLRYDLGDLTGHAPDLSELWGDEGRILEDRVLHAAGSLERLRLTEDFLLKQLGKADKTHWLAAQCLESIMQSKGLTPIDRLADDLSVGRRHLERKFIEATGLSPKLLSRIVRFQHVLQLIENRQFTSLTALAYEGGFYDQAHFIRDFKAFTGLNPGQYFSEDLEMARYFM